MSAELYVPSVDEPRVRSLWKMLQLLGVPGDASEEDQVNALTAQIKTGAADAAFRATAAALANELTCLSSALRVCGEADVETEVDAPIGTIISIHKHVDVAGLPSSTTSPYTTHVDATTEVAFLDSIRSFGHAFFRASPFSFVFSEPLSGPSQNYLLLDVLASELMAERLKHKKQGASQQASSSSSSSYIPSAPLDPKFVVPIITSICKALGVPLDKLKLPRDLPAAVAAASDKVHQMLPELPADYCKPLVDVDKLSTAAKEELERINAEFHKDYAARRVRALQNLRRTLDFLLKSQQLNVLLRSDDPTAAELKETIRKLRAAEAAKPAVAFDFDLRNARDFLVNAEAQAHRHAPAHTTEQERLKGKEEVRQESHQQAPAEASSASPAESTPQSEAAAAPVVSKKKKKKKKAHQALQQTAADIQRRYATTSTPSNKKERLPYWLRPEPAPEPPPEGLDFED